MDRVAHSAPHGHELADAIADAEELDQVLRALADPVRRYLLELLRHDGCTAGDLAASAADRFGISPSRASQHLKVLADARLVTVGRTGTWRYCEYRERSADRVAEWIATLGRP